MPLELELVTEDVYRRTAKDAAQREASNRSIPLSCADKAQTRNSLGPQLPQSEDMLDLQQQQPLAEPQDQPHRFKGGPDWVMVTRSKTAQCDYIRT